MVLSSGSIRFNDEDMGWEVIFRHTDTCIATTRAIAPTLSHSRLPVKDGPEWKAKAGLAEEGA